MNLGYLPQNGCISLIEMYDAIDMSTTYSIRTDDRMEVTGFSDFAREAQLSVGSIVLVTIEKRWPTLGNIKLLRMIINNLS